MSELTDRLRLWAAHQRFHNLYENADLMDEAIDVIEYYELQSDAMLKRQDELLEIIKQMEEDACLEWGLA